MSYSHKKLTRQIHSDGKKLRSLIFLLFGAGDLRRLRARGYLASGNVNAEDFRHRP